LAGRQPVRKIAIDAKHGMIIAGGHFLLSSVFEVHGPHRAEGGLSSTMETSHAKALLGICEFTLHSSSDELTDMSPRHWVCLDDARLTIEELALINRVRLQRSRTP